MKVEELLEALRSSTLPEDEVVFMDKDGELRPIVAVNTDDVPVLLIETLED